MLSASALSATATIGPVASLPYSTAPYRAIRLAERVYAVPGDTGRGSEGRPNAGFVVTDSGVAVIEALASPWEARRLLAAIRRITRSPVRWLILTHHHPDHMMGAVVLRRAGAAVIAHPDRTMLAREGGDDGLVADWDRVVGLHELQGFAFADTPTVPIAKDTTVVLGGYPIALYHPNGAAHTPADLAVWLPPARVLFAGDLVVEDGVTMVVDGNSGILADALRRLDSLDAAVVVPGHGRIAGDAHAQLALTHQYVDSIRSAMREAVERGVPLSRVLAHMPRPDSGRPVSLASRRQRNAERVYLEMEREQMNGATQPDVKPAGLRHTLISTDSLATLVAGGGITLIDARNDVSLYLRSHIPGAVYVNSETLRSMADGVPNLLLPAESYIGLFTRLGIRADRPVVIYSAGETRDIDATYLSWILSGFGMTRVSLVDGGFGKWELEARPTAQTYAPVVPGRYEGRDFSPDRATLDDVRNYLRDRGSAVSGAGEGTVSGAAAAGNPATGSVVLVDARPPDQYTGQLGVQMRRGHIPGAISHPWGVDMTEGLEHTFKSLDIVRAGYVAQGITSDKQIIAYCNGGLESSHLYFVLHDLLGYPHVRVYDGSWTEYAAHPELPVATGH